VRLREGERVHEIVVRGRGQSLEVVLDGRPLPVRVEELSPGRILVLAESRREIVHCVREGLSVHVSWRGAVYRLEEEREGARPGAPGSAHGLEAPMPGKVIAIRVAPGQSVVKGQELLVVEAMKMENALRAPRDGRVKALFAKPGDMVGPGVVLVDLE
jgi:3-methylcrotonyl-CoA carboxylase alpha subunit